MAFPDGPRMPVLAFALTLVVAAACTDSKTDARTGSNDSGDLPYASSSVDGGSTSQEEDCPGAISWDDALQHVGERQTIEGPVVGTVYVASSNGQPTFLNVGRDYPDSGRFTVVIWGDDRDNFAPP